MTELAEWWPQFIAACAAITAWWLWRQGILVTATVSAISAVALLLLSHDLQTATLALAAQIKLQPMPDKATPPVAAEADRLRKRIAVLEQEQRDLISTKDAVVRDRETTLAGIVAQLRQVDPSRATLADDGARASSIARIDGEIAHLAAAFRSLATVRSSAAQDVASVVKLRDKIGVQLDTPQYSISSYPDPEVVKSKVGRYYVVELKDAERGIRYYFEKGRYTLDRRSEEFRASLNTFLADIVSRVHGKVDYDLFVRGSADALPYRGQLEPGFEFTHVRYLKSLGGDKYGDALMEHPVEAKLRNEDLPHLRSAYLQKIITEAYPVRAPIILEGGVTRQVADRDRNAEILLFMNW